MKAFLSILLLLLIAPAGSVGTLGQDLGSLEMSGRVRAAGKLQKIQRKRFYLFRGGLEANKPLVDRIRTAPFTSRDCYYCGLKASPEYIAWLAAEDCESPYCRTISTDDVQKVPEFNAAYRKGLQQFRNKPDLARMWLTTNLSPQFRNGFYEKQRTALDSILGGVKPVQSSMTDSVSVVAIFLDIPLQLAGKDSETFTVSNVVPIEVGGKAVVWACEVNIGAGKKAKLRPFTVPDKSGPAKDCEIVVRDLPACTGGSCQAQ
ncbi:MAG: hypothetical protein AB7J13_00025 [Pyrinomonadaceae bacterium]